MFVECFHFSEYYISSASVVVPVVVVDVDVFPRFRALFKRTTMYRFASLITCLPTVLTRQVGQKYIRYCDILMLLTSDVWIRTLSCDVNEKVVNQLEAMALSECYSFPYLQCTTTTALKERMKTRRWLILMGMRSVRIQLWNSLAAT